MEGQYTMDMQMQLRKEAMLLVASKHAFEAIKFDDPDTATSALYAVNLVMLMLSSRLTVLVSKKDGCDRQNSVSIGYNKAVDLASSLGISVNVVHRVICRGPEVDRGILFVKQNPYAPSSSTECPGPLMCATVILDWKHLIGIGVRMGSNGIREGREFLDTLEHSSNICSDPSKSHDTFLTRQNKAIVRYIVQKHEFISVADEKARRDAWLLTLLIELLH
jgi:hypothetical protein